MTGILKCFLCSVYSQSNGRIQNTKHLRNSGCCETTDEFERQFGLMIENKINIKSCKIEIYLSVIE